MKTIFQTSQGHLRLGWKALILLAGAALFSVFITVGSVIFTAVRLVMNGFERSAALQAATQATESLSVQVGIGLATMLFLLVALFWLVKRVEKQPFHFADFGLTLDKTTFTRLGLGFLLACLLCGTTILAGMFSGSLRFIGFGFRLFGVWEVLKSLALIALLCEGVGFVEELVFRGYLQQRLSGKHGAALGILFSAGLFALAHPFGETPNPLLYLLSALLVGLLFGMLAFRTGSLWTGIGLHVFWNYFQMGIVAVRNAADTRFAGAPLFLFEAANPLTQMAVEAGVIFLVLFIVFILSARPKLPEISPLPRAL